MKLISIFFIILSFSINAQTFVIENQKTIGGSLDDVCKKVIQLDNGNLLLILDSNSPISGDKTINSYGLNDYWIICIDSTLNIKWQKVYGGTGSDMIIDVIFSYNQIVVIGNSTSPISGNKTVANFGSGTSDIWIVCLDINGNEKWQKAYGGSENEKARKIIGNGKNYFLLSTSQSNISGTKSENSKGGYDYWISEIDSLGNQLWDKTIGGNNNDNASSFTIYNSDTLIIVGSSLSTISGDKTENRISSSSYEPDIWTMMFLLNSKNIAWDKTLGGLKEDGNMYGKSESVLVLNRFIYLISKSNSGIGGTKTSLDYGTYDIWLNKLNSNGVKIWDKTYGGSDFDAPEDIQWISNERFLIYGSSSSDISGNKTSGTNGSSDLWFLTIDTLGNIVSDFNIGGADADFGANIIKLTNGSFLVSSTSNSSISGDKTENSKGALDSWTIKLSFYAGLAEPLYKNIVTIFPNPSSNYLTIIIISPNQVIALLQIYNSLGQLVVSQEPNTVEVTIDVRNLKSGVYFVEGFTRKGERFEGKFVKE